MILPILLFKFSSPLFFFLSLTVVYYWKKPRLLRKIADYRSVVGHVQFLFSSPLLLSVVIHSLIQWLVSAYRVSRGNRKITKTQILPAKEYSLNFVNFKTEMLCLWFFKCNEMMSCHLYVMPWVHSTNTHWYFMANIAGFGGPFAIYGFAYRSPTGL